jgi:hypothetical protein
MKRMLDILGTAAFVLIMVPWLGKDYAPSVFGGIGIQVSCLVLAGFLLGVGGVFSLRPWLTNEHRVFFVCFFIMGAGYLGALYGGYLLLHSVDRAADILATDHSQMHRVVDRAISAADFQTRHKAAAQYYVEYGVAIAYAERDGELSRFVPDAATSQKRDTWMETLEEFAASRFALATSLDQTRRNLGLFLGMMALGVLAGAIAVVFLHSNLPAEHRDPPDLARSGPHSPRDAMPPTHPAGKQ